MKKIILYITIALAAAAANAQVGIQTYNPRPNAVLDVEAREGEIQGIKLPHTVQGNITLQDIVAVKPDSLVSINNDGLMFYEVSSGCFKYYHLANAQWWNLCGTPPPAVAEVDCNGSRAAGNYLEGEPLSINNHLTVRVKVSKAGTYCIEAHVKDAANNDETYHFSTKGIFPNAGSFDVIVTGIGQPASSGSHTADVTVNGVLQNCNVPINVLPRDPDYIILSVEQINPSWNIRTPLYGGNYKVAVKLLVYNPGTWGLITSEVNGYSFAATGKVANAQRYNP
ncbi:MAG: hypothetical protein LBB41_00135, partial [Prevotellaceae bacterium]|nr:hypothetical protein [Prevotellaceae bacterium]